VGFFVDPEKDKCRTAKLNEAVALCLNIDNGLSKKETRKLPEKFAVSGLVPGAESNQTPG
jgi:hypothetical protein